MTTPLNPDTYQAMLDIGWTDASLAAAGYIKETWNEFYGNNVVDAGYTLNGVAPSVPVPETTGYNLIQQNSNQYNIINTDFWNGISPFDSQPWQPFGNSLPWEGISPFDNLPWNSNPLPNIVNGITNPLIMLLLLGNNKNNNILNYILIFKMLYGSSTPSSGLNIPSSNNIV